MSNQNVSNVINLLNAEGYQGQNKRTFDESNPWSEIYAARQNGLIMQDTVMAIEDHALSEDKKEVPCLVLLLGGVVKGLVPLFETGLDSENIGERQIKSRMRKMLGQVIAFKVLGIDRNNNLCVLSRKQALEQMQNITWKDIKIGDVRTAIVRDVNAYEAVLNIGGIETTIPAKEMSHGWVRDARDILKTGDSIDVKVINIDSDKKKIFVSMKPLLKDNWEYVPEKYAVNGEYLGVITGIEEYGIFITLEPGVCSLIPLPQSERIRKMLEINQRVVFRINSINYEKKQIQGRFVRMVI